MILLAVSVAARAVWNDLASRAARGGKLLHVQQSAD